MAIIGLAAAVGSVLVSTAMDKVGKKHFFYPTIIAGIIGCVVIWSAKFFVGKNLKAELAILIVGGILVIGVTLVMAGLFTASYRDCHSKGPGGSVPGLSYGAVCVGAHDYRTADCPVYYQSV